MGIVQRNRRSRRAAAPVYDPADYTVDQVVAHVADHPDERAAILAAELAGKARSTLIAQLEE